MPLPSLRAREMLEMIIERSPAEFALKYIGLFNKIGAALEVLGIEPKK